MICFFFIIGMNFEGGVQIVYIGYYFEYNYWKKMVERKNRREEKIYNIKIYFVVYYVMIFYQIFVMYYYQIYCYVLYKI